MEGVWGCAGTFLGGQASGGAHWAPETYGEREEDIDLRQMRGAVLSGSLPKAKVHTQLAHPRYPHVRELWVKV